MQVFIATPAYDGKCVPQFEESLKASLQVLKDNGITATWEFLAGCCYLPIARNLLVQRFMQSGMSDLVFIDADIEWEPEGLLQLLSWPVDIVAGAYRHKTWEETYPVWYRTDSHQRPVLAGLSPLIECWVVPTGFMRLHRRVFETLDNLLGETLDLVEYDITAKERNRYRNYFDTAALHNQWWGEDSNFCRRWTIEMGRPLYVDPEIVLSHWGISPSGKPIAARGSFHEFLSRLPGGINDPGYHDNGIEGYSTVRELQWLFNTARDMQSIVEVGSYYGRSSHALLSGCSGIVTCVDSWKPLKWEDNDSPWKAEARYEQFLHSTSGFPNRAVLRMDSLEAASRMADRSVDMVFIDGDHSKESVLQDIEAWEPKARKMICGHDYNFIGWPEVKETIDNYFGDRVKVHETIWYVEMQ
jgi:hypothetical protein